MKANDNNGVLHQITAVKFVTSTIIKIYKGAQLIWSYIRSCFGSGIWVKDANWSDTESWKNE